MKAWELSQGNDHGSAVVSVMESLRANGFAPPDMTIGQDLAAVHAVSFGESLEALTQVPTVVEMLAEVDAIWHAADSRAQAEREEAMRRLAEWAAPLSAPLSALERRGEVLLLWMRGAR